MSVHPAKTQISLGILPVWSESSLSTWRKLGSLATHWAHSEDSGQTEWMIWVFAGRTLILLVWSCRGSYFCLVQDSFCRILCILLYSFRARIYLLFLYNEVKLLQMLISCLQFFTPLFLLILAWSHVKTLGESTRSCVQTPIKFMIKQWNSLFQ